MSTIRSKIEQNTVVLNEQPNVVLLMVGNQDISGIDPGDYPTLNSTRTELEQLIDVIFSQCHNCVTIVSHLPPVA